jgi:hypothetical protein
MSLESVLKEIQTQKPFSEEDVDSGPSETLNGRRGRKNNAIEMLKTLKAQYRLDLLKSAVFILTVGSQRKEFEDIATGEKFNLFSSDPEEFYNDLAGRVPASLYLGKEGAQNVFDVLGRHLEDKMTELDSLGYNQLIFKEKYIRALTNASQFTSIVKEVINDQMGTEIVGIQAIQSIMNKAIERGHASKTTSVVLSVGDEKLAMDLLRDLGERGNRIVLVIAGKSPKSLNGYTNDIVSVLRIKEATEETVKQTLDQIKSSLKK